VLITAASKFHRPAVAQQPAYPDHPSREALGLTLDRFEDRAELWALLAHIDLAAADAD